MDARRMRLILVFFIVSSSITSAQFRKVLHKTFELKKAPEINLDLTGDHIMIENWSGDVVMTETTVHIERGSNSMLDHFTEKGRYEILATDPDSTVIIIITSKVKDRGEIKVRKRVDEEVMEVPIEETVHVKVFVPEEYESQDETRTRWKLKPLPEEEETTTPKGGKPHKKEG